MHADPTPYVFRLLAAVRGSWQSIFSAALTILLAATPQLLLAAAPQPPDKPAVVEPLQLDDPVEPLVPLRPRTGREEDHIRALALFAAARVAEQKQDYEAALRNYQRAYRFDPDALAALREIVPLAFNLDRQAEGVRYALILAEADPSDRAMLRRLAIYLTQDGEIKRALGLYEKAVELQEAAGAKPTSDTVLTWMELARLYFVEKQFDKAARYFSQVSEALDNPAQYKLSPSVVKALVNKGQVTYQLFGESFLEAGRADDALAAFEKVEQAQPNEARHLYNLARVEASRNQPAQALAKLEEYLAAHHSTQGMGPYELYAEMLDKLGQQDQLFNRLEKFRAADANNLPLAYFLAERYREAGQLDQAGPIYAEIIATRDERPPLEALIGLVEVYRRQQDIPKLLDALGQAVSRGGSLAPLGQAGKDLLADEQAARALVEAATQLLADDADADNADADSAQPDEADYNKLLAAGLVAVGTADYDAAEELLNAALESDDAQPSELFVNWGLELFMANQYDRAVQVFERGLAAGALAKDNPAIFFYLAGALEMSGQTDKAVQRAVEAAQLKKDSPRFAARAAWIQFHAKRYAAARKSYEALLARFDKNRDSPDVRDAMRDARLVLSNIAVAEDELDEAEEWLEQVLDEFPEDAGAMNDLGYLWADADKHLDRALDMIQTAVEHDPKNPAYRDSLGWVLYRLGKYPEAVAELRVAASAPDPDGVILDHLGDALDKAGQTSEAIDAWRRAAEAFAESSETDKAERAREKIKQAESRPAEGPSAADPPSDEPEQTASETPADTPQ